MPIPIPSFPLLGLPPQVEPISLKNLPLQLGPQKRLPEPIEMKKTIKMEGTGREPTPKKRPRSAFPDNFMIKVEDTAGTGPPKNGLGTCKNTTKTFRN